ncbi:unnamed protein product, partial [Closterium sp. NIES-53]
MTLCCVALPESSCSSIVSCRRSHRAGSLEIATSKHPFPYTSTTRMLFARLDDTPMLRKQLASLEESLELLRDRCCQLARSCNDFAASLGESFEAESAFVHAMERFFGAPEDAVSIATGGPVLGQFVMTLRDLTIFKETLKSQMEHVLHDRITNFVENDLNNLKEVRRRYDKAGRQYDQ